MGFIETTGLVPAIVAADAALKAANVTLIGRENSKGAGMVTVKLSGNVGAVKAALAAGVAEANRIGKVVSAAIIVARPAVGFAPIMAYNSETMAVDEWLKAISSDLAPGKVITVEGKIREGALDGWHVKRLKKEKKETEEKASITRGCCTATRVRTIASSKTAKRKRTTRKTRDEWLKAIDSDASRRRITAIRKGPKKRLRPLPGLAQRVKGEETVAMVSRHTTSTQKGGTGLPVTAKKKPAKEKVTRRKRKTKNESEKDKKN